MTFAALLTKELRLRLRRERTIWVLITYLLVMTLLGFLFISRTSAYNSNSVSTLGLGLYTLLVFVQLFLIMFITPAFTATSINGEKERQTFDLLLCSRLSAFELVACKLVAGLANAALADRRVHTTLQPGFLFRRSGTGASLSGDAGFCGHRHCGGYIRPFLLNAFEAPAGLYRHSIYVLCYLGDHAVVTEFPAAT